MQFELADPDLPEDDSRRMTCRFDDDGERIAFGFLLRMVRRTATDHAEPIVPEVCNFLLDRCVRTDDPSFTLSYSRFGMLARAAQREARNLTRIRLIGSIADQLVTADTWKDATTPDYVPDGLV